MRLFVALELPPEIVATLGRLAPEHPGLRALPATSLHVTLAFLGERPDAEAGAIGAAVLACAAPVPGLQLGEPAWLGRGSALAIDIADTTGAGARLQRQVADALAALGAYAAEERAFRPHVTIARVRRGARVPRRLLPDVPQTPPFAGTALTLFRSQLSPRGASYAPLARAPLGPG